MSNPYLAIEMMDLHPDERAELLKVRHKQLKKRWHRESQAYLVGKLVEEFAMSKTHIYNILNKNTPT